MSDKMNEKKNRKGLIRGLAAALAVILTISMTTQSTSTLISSLAEGIDPLTRIYDMLAGAVEDPQTSEDYAELANIAIGRSDYELSLSHLEKSRKLADPADSITLGGLWLKSASVYVLMGDAENAMIHLDNALTADPACAQALLLKAQINIELGLTDMAIVDLEAYIALAPTDTATWLTLAQLYESLGKYAEAREEYTALYEVENTNVSHLLNAHRCGFLNGDYEASLAAFDAYLTENPEAEAEYRSIAAFLKAACLMQLTRYDEAVAGFRAAVSEGYDAATCYEQMTLCCFENGDYEQTVVCGEEAIANGVVMAAPDAFNQRIGAALMQLGRYEEAVNYLTAAIELNPELVGSYYYRGISNLSLSNHEAAVEDFTKSLEQEFLTQFCYYTRGVCYVQMSDYEKALEDFGMTLKSGEDTELIQGAKDILWQLAAYYENQAALTADPSAVPADDTALENAAE